MKAFLSIKFWGDDRNREDIEAIIGAAERAGFSVFCFRRDAEEWGKNQFKSEEMMRRTFNQIEQSDVVIANVADWPIGVGAECGYAYAKGISIICIYPIDTKVANTVAGLAKLVIKYESYEDLSRDLASFKNQLLVQ